MERGTMMSPPTSGPSAASPASVAGSSESSLSNLTPKEMELQRKRARDRKSQQAMRDRTKWTISNLNEQVAFLTQVLEERTRDVGVLDSRLRVLETENAHLRTQNAALQLSLLGSPTRTQMPSAARLPLPKNPWEIPPLNSPPTCISDQILQEFVSSKVEQRASATKTTPTSVPTYGLRPNLASLLYRDRRTNDDFSNIVSDVIKSYLEINTLPKQVACVYIISTFLKWVVHLDKQSWDLMPAWLQPTQAQITVAHAAWIDRLPWPKARDYLVRHPEITLDDFAAAYSSSFSIAWPYDPSHVLIVSQNAVMGSEDVTTNPVYEEHLQQLKNWSVGKTFRERWPDIAILIDADSSAASV